MESILNLRKVALVVASLDRDTADRLLDQFAPDRAQTIRDAVLSLTHVEAAESRLAIHEFLGLTADRIRVSKQAEPDRATVPTVTSVERSKSNREARRGLEADWLSLPAIDRASECVVAKCLREELPQAIARALAQLPTHRASEVVSFLPADQQAQVLERMVELDPSASSEFADIRDEFQTWLNQKIERALRQSELAARLATILDAAHSGARKKILRNVSNSDVGLAKELQDQLTGITSTV